MTYSQFTDEDLLRAIYNQDRLVTSDLELELTKRRLSSGAVTSQRR